MRTLAYPLPALNLSEPECIKIMKPVLDASLAKTRVSRHFPQSVIYGPKQEKGLGYSDLFLQQGLSHISIIQQHLNTKTITGSFLRNSIELMKIEIGLGYNLFSLDFEVYGTYATDCWIKSTWAFSYIHHINIKETVTSNVILRRQNDAYIMEAITNLQRYGKAELNHINRCRLYLQVTALSNITTACGQYFTHSAYHCSYDSTIPHHYDWPVQPCPYSYARRLWKQAIKHAFPRHGHLLLRHLGPWIDNARDDWIWFNQPSTGRLYRRYNMLWRMYIRTSRAGAIGRHPRYRYCTQAISLPNNTHRASVRRIDRRTVKLTGTSRIIREIMIEQPHVIDRRANLALRAKMQESYSYVNAPINEIERMLIAGKLKLVSDGSFLNTLLLGTAAWIIALSCHKYIIGRHFTPGPGNIQCSHRSELSGILGAILHANDLCTQFNIESGIAELHCDGQGAIDVVSYLHSSTNPSRKHFDLIHSITTAINDSPLQWEFKHVRGHQDDSVDTLSLTDWEY